MIHLALLRRGDDEPARDRPPDLAGEEDEDDEPGIPRIRCPRCGWQPRRRDLWSCVCLAAWNTFETRGVCPGCGIAWKETQCLRCHEWSVHEHWYEQA